MIKAEVDRSGLLLLAAGCIVLEVRGALGVDGVTGLSDVGPWIMPTPMLDFFFFVMLWDKIWRNYARMGLTLMILLLPTRIGKVLTSIFKTSIRSGTESAGSLKYFRVALVSTQQVSTLVSRCATLFLCSILDATWWLGTYLT